MEHTSRTRKAKRGIHTRIGAFTLGELIVVITILAVLATIGFLALSGYSQDAKNSVVATNVRSLYSAITAESALTGNSPRYYVIHDSGASLSGGIVFIDGNSNSLTGGDWNAPNTNYSAGNPDYVKLKINKDKFKISALFWSVAFASYDPKNLTVWSTDLPTVTASNGKKRLASYVQVAGISPDTNKVSVMGNFPIGNSGSVSGLVKDPSSGSSTGALVDGGSSSTPSCSGGMVWNGSACAVPPFSYTYVISANATNYNLRTAAIAAGWDQVKPLSANVTVSAWVTVGSASAASAAFDATGSFPSWSTLTLVNNGSILGKWGDGGYGWTWNWSPSAWWAGWKWLDVSVSTIATNNGTIAWGGGGGGGGGGGSPDCSSYCVWGGGGGGGAWSAVGAGGGGHPCGWYPGAGGNNGWSSIGGIGGNGASDGGNSAGRGWAGWSLWNNWAAGVNASTSCSPTLGAAGGIAGAAVSGNANVTWIANGTKIGTSN